MHNLDELDGCQWLHCRQNLDKYRRHCVDTANYLEAARADARAKELMKLEGQWHREVLLKRFLAERRKLGHEFQKEFKDLLLELDQSFKAFKAEKQKRRANVGRKNVKEHSWPLEQEGSEEAEEEERDDDEILEDSLSQVHSKAQRTWSEEIKEDNSKAISDPTTLVMSTFPLVTRAGDPVEEKQSAPETYLPCRVHSVKAIELRHKARKLALVQRYAAAAKLQAKAQRIEEEWQEIHVAKVKEQEKDRSQEMLEREKLRLERRLEEEQQALGNDALRAQQQLLQQHSRRKDRLVRRQLKTWKSAGGLRSLEEALREAAGRGDSSVSTSEDSRPSRPASAPGFRR